MSTTKQGLWNGILFRRRMEITPRTGMQRSLIQITRDGHTSREIHRQRVYPIRTVIALLRRASLLPLGVHDFYSLRAPTSTTRRVVYVGRKRG